MKWLLVILLCGCTSHPTKSERFNAMMNDTNAMRQLSDHVVEMRREMHKEHGQ